MNLNQYVLDAIRTESQVENVNVDPVLLIETLKVFIASGNMLDQIKKNVFYGKEIVPHDTIDLMERIQESLFVLTESPVALPEDVEIEPRVFHALVGIATEATELMEALLESIIGNKDLDRLNVLEELGDVNWYQAIGIDALDGDFETILNTNIEKLRKRFPEKFTSENAIERNLEEERNTLESGLT